MFHFTGRHPHLVVHGEGVRLHELLEAVVSLCVPRFKPLLHLFLAADPLEFVVRFKSSRQIFRASIFSFVLEV